MFSVVPLLFLAFSLWLARGCRGRSSSPRSPRWRRLRSCSRCRSEGCSTSASSRTRSASSRCTGSCCGRTSVSTPSGGSCWEDRGGARVCAPPPQAGPRCAPVGGGASAPAGVRRRIRLDPRPLARNRSADRGSRAELDRRGDRHRRRGGISVRGDRRSHQRSADPLADRVLEPEHRDRLSARSAGACASRRGWRNTRPAHGADHPRAPAREGDPVRGRPYLGAAGRRSLGSHPEAGALPGRSARAVCHPAGGGLCGRLDGQRRGVHQYATSRGRPGRLRSRVSRDSWNGPSVPGV